MASTDRRMHLGVFVLGTGNHIAGWRYPGAADSFQSLPVIQEIARTAERGKFDLLFLGDNLVAGVDDHPSFTARFEPLTMLAALAATTTRVGLGATSSTTYGEPFLVARAFASLDHLSGGRAAWNAVTSSGPGAAANFGREHPRHDARYEMAEEFVDVVRGLWDCWDDGAIVADRATGQYIDPSKVRALDHDGRFFKVKGPLNIGRTPQGRPVILQAGSSEAGLALAARTADVVFSVVQDFGEARLAYRALKDRLAPHGRRDRGRRRAPRRHADHGRHGSGGAREAQHAARFRHRHQRRVAALQPARHRRVGPSAWTNRFRTSRCRTHLTASPAPCSPRRSAKA